MLKQLLIVSLAALVLGCGTPRKVQLPESDSSTETIGKLEAQSITAPTIGPSDIEPDSLVECEGHVVGGWITRKLEDKSVDCELKVLLDGKYSETMKFIAVSPENFRSFEVGQKVDVLYHTAPMPSQEDKIIKVLR